MTNKIEPSTSPSSANADLVGGEGGDNNIVR
jgi:hypothetical protein